MNDVYYDKMGLSVLFLFLFLVLFCFALVVVVDGFGVCDVLNLVVGNFRINKRSAL